MKRIFTLTFVAFSIASAYAQVEEKKMDELIQNTLKNFDVPGISVGVIKDGKTVYAKGFGKRSLKPIKR